MVGKCFWEAGLGFWTALECGQRAPGPLAVSRTARLHDSVARLARRFNVSATQQGLSPTQASILGLIVTTGPIALPELVRIEGVHPTMLSRVVSKLVDAGLIHRFPDLADLRSILVKATRNGVAVRRRISAERAAVVQANVAGLSPDETDNLEQALSALEALTAKSEHEKTNRAAGRKMSSAVQTLTDATFDADVLQADGPVLVDFWAEWCGPCKKMAPILDQIAAGHRPRLRVAKTNIDQNPDAARSYQIMSIPALLVFDGRQVVKRLVGALTVHAAERAQ
jgi:thioredoxin 1